MPSKPSKSSPCASRFPSLCAGLLLLAACGNEEPPRLTDSGPARPRSRASRNGP